MRSSSGRSFRRIRLDSTRSSIIMLITFLLNWYENEARIADGPSPEELWRVICIWQDQLSKKWPQGFRSRGHQLNIYMSHSFYKVPLDWSGKDNYSIMYRLRHNYRDTPTFYFFSSISIHTGKFFSALRKEPKTLFTPKLFIRLFVKLRPYRKYFKLNNKDVRTTQA